MKDTRPTWVLVVDCAEVLTRAGSLPFRLAQLIAEVQRIDPSRSRGSIQPVVQGMTVNAGKGPASPCGKVLVRVHHGHYRLLEEADGGPCPRTRSSAARPPVRRQWRARSLRQQQFRARLDSLITDFDAYVERYDRLVPFTRSGQYERHRQAIDRRRAVGSAEAAAADDRFTDLLHATLQAWGIGRRASRLAPFDQFRRRLRERAADLRELEDLRLEDPSLDVAQVARQLDHLIDVLAVVDNRARVVAGTKTLHHLLPDLVPPMDRAWTGAFFGWTLLDPQNRQTEIFTEAFAGLAGVAVAASPSRLVGAGWRSSPTKVVDNALIGFCQLHGIGGSVSQSR